VVVLLFKYTIFSLAVFRVFLVCIRFSCQLKAFSILDMEMKDDA
jgi:hypothetical protein